MNIEKTLLERIKEKTGVEFETLLIDINNFLEENFPKITNYFLGKKTELSPVVFQDFEVLKFRFIDSTNRVYYFRSSLFNKDYLDYLEKLELLRDKLDTISNLHRWLRSSISNFSYQKDLQVQYLLQYGDTLETISRNILKRGEFLDNWLDVALSNSMSEENYEIEGGKELSLPLDNKVTSFSLNSVVDSIQGKSCYGKDISEDFLFKENDLVTLGYLETVQQSVDILIRLRKGDNLDNVEQGVQQGVFIGSNRVYFNTPILIRQLVETFSTDDTLINFKVLEIKLEQDNFFLDFQVETILGEIFNKQLSFS